MEIVLFLIAVGVIALGVLVWVKKSGSHHQTGRGKNVSQKHHAPLYQAKSAAHVMQHGHAGHADVAREKDIWRGRRQHATERSQKTGTFNASRILFDHENDESSEIEEDLSMTSIEYKPEPAYSPKAAHGK